MFDITQKTINMKVKPENQKFNQTYLFLSILKLK